MKAEGLAHGADASDGYYDSSAPPSPYRGGTDSYHGHVSRPQRGGYSRGRGGYAGYHPYQRAPVPFKNKSVVFNRMYNRPDSSEEASPSKKAVPRTTSGAHVNDGRQQPIEPHNLCPAFTSTGTSRDNR
jgi:hypothetical protein